MNIDKETKRVTMKIKLWRNPSPSITTTLKECDNVNETLMIWDDENKTLLYGFNSPGNFATSLRAIYLEKKQDLVEVHSYVILGGWLSPLTSFLQKKTVQNGLTLHTLAFEKYVQSKL